MNTDPIRQRLDEILDFMNPYWEFVNCHMVGYITDDHWKRHVPEELRAEVDRVDKVDECIEQMFWCERQGESTNQFPAFERFLSSCDRHRLSNFPEILTSPEKLKSRLRNEAPPTETEDQSLSIREFMSEKKRHEVEITAELVDFLISHHLNSEGEKNQRCFVVDAGDGKGYLSSRLSLQYGHKVLGIDANESNTENALDRGKKLERAWNGLTERAKLESQGVTPPRRGKKPKNSTEKSPEVVKLAENYKTTSQYITPDLETEKLLEEHFPSAKTTASFACLTGLHTCGNLAPTCLQVFHAQPLFKILCNIGCCYHLLKESYSGQEFFGNKAIADMQTHAGFPMSLFLQTKRQSLGRNARMLATQSVERTREAKDLPNVSLYYRALLEVLICQQDDRLKDAMQVGKIRKFSSFQEYVDLCGKKLQMTFDPEAVEKVEITLSEHKKYLDLFYLLRMSFAPVLESLILLDRLLYLRESGHSESYLMPLFDPVISPRCFCILALKR